ncbi:MAG: hypothetical protein AAFY52_05210 [Pseudomonadota bacterium]
MKARQKSRHFTVTCVRVFSGAQTSVFDKWISGAARSFVVGAGLGKTALKVMDIHEGGKEVYEDRRKNQIFSTTCREYVVIEKPSLIICHVSISMPNSAMQVRQHFATQEMLYFKPVSESETELVKSNQVACVQPTYVDAVTRAIEEEFDMFEKFLDMNVKEST